MERVDYLERLKQEYCLTYLKVQRLTKELAGAIRGTLVKKKVPLMPHAPMCLVEHMRVE